MENKNKRRKKRLNGIIVCLSLISGEAIYGKEPDSFQVEAVAGLPFSEGAALVVKRTHVSAIAAEANSEMLVWRYGFIDKQGEYLVIPKYVDARSYKEGLAAVAEQINGRVLYGYIDKKGKVCIDMQFEKASIFSEGLAAVQQDSKWGYINHDGEWVVKPIYIKANNFTEGLAFVESEEKSWQFINSNGSKIISIDSGLTHSFSEGKTAVGSTDWIWSDGSFVDALNNASVSSFDRFSEGVISTIIPYSSELKKTQYSYANNVGVITIPGPFDMAYSFSEGLAAVIKDNMVGFINKNGRQVIPFKFAVEKNFPIPSTIEFSEGVAPVSGGYIDRKGKFVITFK